MHFWINFHLGCTISVLFNSALTDYHFSIEKVFCVIKIKLDTRKAERWCFAFYGYLDEKQFVKEYGAPSRIDLSLVKEKNIYRNKSGRLKRTCLMLIVKSFTWVVRQTILCIYSLNVILELHVGRNTYLLQSVCHGSCRYLY